MWLMWLSSMVVIGIVATVLVYIRVKHVTRSRNRLNVIDNMFMYLFGTMSGQGNYSIHSYFIIHFKLNWCRRLLPNFAAFFFINIYNSILTSRLSAHYQFPEIKSLEELANKKNYQLATLRDSVWEIDLMVNSFDFYLKNWTCMDFFFPKFKDGQNWNYEDPGRKIQQSTCGHPAVQHSVETVSRSGSLSICNRTRQIEIIKLKTETADRLIIVNLFITDVICCINRSTATAS